MEQLCGKCNVGTERRLRRTQPTRQGFQEGKRAPTRIYVATAAAQMVHLLHHFGGGQFTAYSRQHDCRAGQSLLLLTMLRGCVDWSRRRPGCRCLPASPAACRIAPLLAEAA